MDTRDYLTTCLLTSRIIRFVCNSKEYQTNKSTKKTESSERDRVKSGSNEMEEGRFEGQTPHPRVNCFDSPEDDVHQQP